MKASYCLALIAISVFFFQFTSADSSGVCDLDKDRGLCFAYMTRYYYDRETRTCKEFTYGGCGGNGNNFNTKEECEATCIGVGVCDLDKDMGLCYASMTRYYYDGETRTCKEFTYGGCGGNKNNFNTKAACEATCMGGNR